MSLNPLNELKRHLDNSATPLPKRICLAKNLIQSHHFPSAPKERVVGTWLHTLTVKNELPRDELRNVLEWVNVSDHLTSEMKSILIQILSQYIQSNPIGNNDIPFILQFLGNTRITPQLNQHIDEYLKISITVLLCLKHEEQLNVTFVKQLISNIIKYYKECKKKLEFIIKFISEDHLETLFSFLGTECSSDIIELCQNVMFPITRKSCYISYLQTLIRKDNINELMLEKGDNIQSVLKIMSALFDVTKGEKDHKFIRDFIEIFISCFHSESQVVFAFCIMIVNFLGMPQDFIKPAMSLEIVKFEGNAEKIRRNLFLNILEILLLNEVDISIRLTDTFGEKISKVEIKKNFMSFLQAVMMGQLKLDGKPDKATMNIIKTALKLDPTLIEQKLTVILPPIMTAKKHNAYKCYVDMLSCLMEMLFKLSRGIPFLSQILPYIKNNLEDSNTEQFELKQSVTACLENGTDCENLMKKIINGNDIFPEECVESYGKYTSELMFRQNKEVLELLQKDFEEHCLMMLEEGFVSPSIITIAEVLAAILSSFLRYNKMADHTVPFQISEDFWNAFDKFERECLKRFGECTLKLSYNPPLVLSFLKLCVSFAQLKLLNIKYSNYKLKIETSTSETFDMSSILPCLNSAQWIDLMSKIKDEETIVLNELLTVKSMALELLDNKEDTVPIKSYLVSEFARKIDNVLNDETVLQVLCYDLTKSQYKQIAKTLIKRYSNNSDAKLFNDVTISNNRVLLNYLTLETVKQIAKCFDNADSLSKAISKIDFTKSFCKKIDMKEYFLNITIPTENFDTIKNYIELLKNLQVPYLDENYQLAVIFVLLATKRNAGKKLRRNTDCLIQSIFEMGFQPPDLYKIFPVDFVFSFEDGIMIDLLTLTNKTSNNLLVIKNVLASSVKRVKANNEIVKKLVELIINKENKALNSIEGFREPAFQISCIILPLIAKQKKALTTSAHRSILADLQDKLHRELLKAFKNIDFVNGSFVKNISGNTENSMVESNAATLNAMAAYTLTLSKYCEATKPDEANEMECVLKGLEFFVETSIRTIEEATSESQQIESSLGLLNVMLRHIKKLDTHEMFKEKDKLFSGIWRSLKTRLSIVFSGKASASCLDDGLATLRSVCESMSVECFVANVAEELMNLSLLKKPAIMLKDKSNGDLTSHKVSRYIWAQCLKANIVGPKCAALTKVIARSCKSLRFWLRQHYEWDSVASKKRKKIDLYDERNVKIVRIEDKICEIIKINMDNLSEVILSAKKMSLDYKFLDSVFSLIHIVNAIICPNSTEIKYEITWRSYFGLFEGCLTILNNMLLSREEMLEDRWPNYMQCYRALILCVCLRTTSETEPDRDVEERLAQTAHDIEMLTQSITKRKRQVSRVAAYAVGDLCALLERGAPARPVRLHAETCVALLTRAADCPHAAPFLRRALAGSPGHLTAANLYTMYKRYYKYVGNS
ncbi:uncharacterized protein LOC101739009 [Bombyx mori]|uniref:Nucleolar 27S pre-rRNA processing Urb2/Npa2 C-terminal domain-containing protein n=1 Tax=Bombyx mori TaxID=7091 RepID=A0A8R2R600_BOMMO|nr:uncharacterized protein LOC101739009 [Bombyx mori]